MIPPRTVALVQAAMILCLAAPISPEAPLLAQPTLSVNEIIQRMEQHDADQFKELQHYRAIRHYQVQYAGLGTSLRANMDVEIAFDHASGKNFRILSESGSKLLCDKVLRRAVESEREASQDKDSIALAPSNYRFQLVGTEQLDGKTTYVLRVDPWHESKFLYRGTVWLDTQDFAVVKVQAVPSKNPSIWISHTLIEYTNSKTDGMWLPDKNRSESKIRVGGIAVLSIDYGDYDISLVG